MANTVPLPAPTRNLFHVRSTRLAESRANQRGRGTGALTAGNTRADFGGDCIPIWIGRRHGTESLKPSQVSLLRKSEMSTSRSADRTYMILSLSLSLPLPSFPFQIIRESSRRFHAPSRALRVFLCKQCFTWNSNQPGTIVFSPRVRRAEIGGRLHRLELCGPTFVASTGSTGSSP
jgi:hypothetical protein